MSHSILQTELEAAARAAYPLHMPGHKRRVPPAPGLGCYAWDTTEIPATDDLHDAHGILADAMARTAALWGSQRCWYLVGGSTVGLLAGIRAVAPFGSEILCARNCHKSVYHAIELGHLTAHWLTPPLDEAFGIYGSVSPLSLAEALAAHPAARCVVLTSPTYEGVVSDIASLAALCHAHGVPLLVDEAHGSHLLPFADRHGWPRGAVAAGADLVVQSAHKTLPSLTQTALLHLNGTLVDPGEIERQLDVFETSSPSYPLLASLDGCTSILAQDGERLFAAWRARLARFSAAAVGFSHIRVLCHGRDLLRSHPAFYDFDDSKLLVGIGQPGAAFLRRRGFEPEMVCGPNLLALTSPCDEEDALDRLARVLGEYDCLSPSALPVCGLLPPPGETRCSLAEALLRPAADLPPEQALHRTAAEYVWAYPPGVPLLVPGEEITPEFLDACRALEEAGTSLHHTAAAPGLLRVAAL